MLAGSLAAALSAEPANLAIAATPSTSYVSGHERLDAINDGFTPVNSHDKSHGTHGNWPRTGTQWVQFDWPQPAFINAVQVYWFTDDGGLRIPKAARLKYWNGSDFALVPGASVGVEPDKFNETRFGEISTSRLRLEFDSDGGASTAVVEWRVLDSGRTPNFPPIVKAGVARVVVLSGQTYLEGVIKDDGRPKGLREANWSKHSGPGRVRFDAANQSATTARFSAPGEYVLKLTGSDGEANASDTLKVRVQPNPPKGHLDPVWTTSYMVSSPFWKPRLKNLIVNWIPHCIQKCEDPESKEGGIDNFVQARRKLAGEPGAKHTGAVFANTWVYNTLESMCIAQMLDPQGDREIAAAQTAMRKTIDDWVPKIIGAQEPDGYLHTQYTIEGHRRWTDKHAHEDYQAGYFMETAIAHHLMTGRKDGRMLEAAMRLADCWVRNLGPAPKRTWYPGHQELEMALVKLGRYIEPTDPEKSKAYVALAKFLLDSRQGGDEYDQSHAPVTRQYEAVGHAVRAIYSYCGMADVAMETGDSDYLSAVQSLWHSIVNRKYYVTGGIGSGETSEGFGKDYSLPNNAYCESCANCGEMYFQQRLQMIYREGFYADLAEETLFNAILGDVDLDAQNYTYTNPLDSSGKRYKWHVCPCCVGNIPRTLLSLPTWAYTVAKSEIYVNQFAGSTVTLDNIAGTSVQFVQTTDYPWAGKVALAVNPASSKKFTVKIRVPNRQTSLLYTNTPAVEGLLSLAVNGKPVKPRMANGYAVLDRTWKAGDRVEWEVPLKIQRVKADHQIAADRGRVALRYGPLIYNLESVDQNVDAALSSTAALANEWKPDLLGGVMVIKGQFADGQPLLAIPNYARLNRGGRSIVWMKAE